MHLNVRNESSDAASRIKNLLLTEMDGFEDRGQVIVLGATNKPWNLTQNLLRRFDRQFYIGLPDKQTRKNFIKDLLSQSKFSNTLLDKDIEELSEKSAKLQL